MLRHISLKHSYMYDRLYEVQFHFFLFKNISLCLLLRTFQTRHWDCKWDCKVCGYNLHSSSKCQRGQLSLPSSTMKWLVDIQFWSIEVTKEYSYLYFNPNYILYFFLSVIIAVFKFMCHIWLQCFIILTMIFYYLQFWWCTLHQFSLQRLPLIFLPNKLLWMNEWMNKWMIFSKW